MLGNLISRIREEKEISKTDLATLTGINVGHLTHIEKGERNPSHKALKSICDALKVPYQPLFYTYENELTDEMAEFDLIDSITYDKIPLISSIESYVDVPKNASSASIAFRMKDDSMKGSIPKNTICFLEFNAIPLHKEFGLFKYNNEYLVRRILYKKNKIVLKTDNLFSKDISISSGDELSILGRIYVEN
ncbi:MAG: helix-turn-helix domain-containing protein [Clostridia bacterium]|nr:helix-turn-helix domain-containing protein [Clostridia bacterium]